MRGGKSIWLIAGGFLLVAILEPAWQWYFGKVLDSLSRPSLRTAPVIAMTWAAHNFLFGVSFGMILAFVIGYWRQVDTTLEAIFTWVYSLLWIIFQSRPGKRLVSYGEASLAAGEMTKTIKIASYEGVNLTEGHISSNDAIINLISTDMVRITRLAGGGNPPLQVRYQIFGRRSLMDTFSNLRRLDFVSLYRFRDEHRRAQTVIEQFTIADHSPRWPQDIATRKRP